MQSAYIIASYANRMSTFVGRNLEQQLLQVLAWHSETDLVVLIAVKVNWQVVGVGLHRGKTDKDPQSRRLVDRNELGAGCVMGIMVMELFSTKMAGRPVIGIFSFWHQVFPHCQGSTH